jgi:PIN domain nuclease of toxin-antitoxin system
MRYLLDTHALIWWWIDSPRLSANVRALMTDPANDFLVSAASAWEIATKYRIGKLTELEDPVGRFASLMESNRFIRLAITEDHALCAGALTGDHRDPFDRMIAAQALVEGVAVVTLDPAFVGFGCRVVW